jgi:hypothetical protein
MNKEEQKRVYKMCNANKCANFEPGETHVFSVGSPDWGTTPEYYTECSNENNFPDCFEWNPNQCVDTCDLLHKNAALEQKLWDEMNGKTSFITMFNIRDVDMEVIKKMTEQFLFLPVKKDGEVIGIVTNVDQEKNSISIELKSPIILKKGESISISFNEVE